MAARAATRTSSKLHASARQQVLGTILPPFAACGSLRLVERRGTVPDSSIQQKEIVERVFLGKEVLSAGANDWRP